MSTSTRMLSAGAFILWSLPALWSLAQQTWRTEAGSLAPLVLALGFWSLFESHRRVGHLASNGHAIPGVAVISLVLPVYLFASAIDLVSVMALCVWVAGVATFYVLNGAAVTRACMFPLAFLGLVVPLPYSLTLSGNVILRDFVARSASDLGRVFQMETASDAHYLFVDQYKLAIDTACAGLSSTMSLVAIGLLFVHWMQGTGWRGYLVAVIISAPIALLANVLRIVALLFLVKTLGPGLLDTAIHPLSGILSFGFALAMFAVMQRLVHRLLKERGE